MTWKKSGLCLAVVSLLLGSAAHAAHHEAEYDQLGENWEAAYNNEGAAAVAAMYLEDGMRMPPDTPVVKGRKAVQAQIQEGMDRGQAKVEIEMVESHVSGELGVASGKFKTMDASGNLLAVHLDIWNFDAPLQAPSE
jgi:ketosteroid isomerase-like protein